ncbi:L,D-transpeptidase family protein [Thioalkalivibrio sp.]|uniref:L,D-transpeptidase family protein n=1 Tax=Thioalkalivibrio sp. TaxID=2093813 RepID=UPI0035683090
MLALCTFASGATATDLPDDAWPRGHHPLPENSDLIGENYVARVRERETLVDIAREHNVGFEEIRIANPNVSIWAPAPGTEVLIPARHILPDAPREGIVINLSEMRLYYYSSPEVVETYPISVGREEFATPVGVTRTTVKVRDPSWSPPQSMREEAAVRGEPTPEVVPPGPENPLGRHAILLDLPSYLIHGTNQPDGVGMRVSRGCIRMFPEDIESLFDRVPAGTRVNIIDQPFKAGWSEDNVLYVQSFPQLEENVGSLEPVRNALDVVALVAFEDNLNPVAYRRLRQLVENPNGLAVPLRGPSRQSPGVPE